MYADILILFLKKERKKERNPSLIGSEEQTASEKLSVSPQIYVRGSAVRVARSSRHLAWRQKFKFSNWRDN